MGKVSLGKAPWEESELVDKGSPEHYRRLVGKAFDGNATPRDILYMAKALLQLNDEMHELRERLTILERAFKSRG